MGSGINQRGRSIYEPGRHGGTGCASWVLKSVIAEKAKENERKGGGSGSSGRQKSDNPTTTSKELAKVAGVSHDTIHKVETIEAKAASGWLRWKSLLRIFLRPFKPF